MNSEAPQISAVIPAFKRADSVLKLLTDLYLQEGCTFEIIVVDDHSPEDIQTPILKAFPLTRFFRNEVNGGPCVSRNRGIREARGEFIVGIDSDVTVPDKTLFMRIVKTFREFPEAAALALRVMSPDGITDDGPRWAHPFPIKPYAEQWVWTDYLSGTGYAFRRQPLAHRSLYPELLYMHHEEVEMSYRILEEGGPLLHCPDLQLLHHPHPVANRNRNETYFNPRNYILLAAGLFPWPRAIIYLSPRIPKQFLRALFNRHLGSFFEAMFDAFKLLPHRLKERNPIKRSTLREITRLRKSPIVARVSAVSPAASAKN